ncbi:MAG: outer membrane beta-barrel protein [Magnetococcus sp. WYHC-3]
MPVSFPHPSGSRGLMPRMTAGALALLTGFLALSQGYGASGPSPRGIPLGIFRVQPEVTLSSGYTDNIFKTKTEKENDYLLTIRPVLLAATNWRQFRFKGGYSGSYQRHRWNESEDREDHGFDLDLVALPGRNLELNLKSSVDFKHDTRGQPDVAQNTPGVPPDAWNHYTVNGGVKFTYNRVRALAELGRSLEDKDSYGSITDNAGLKLFLALAPKTSLTLGGKTSWVRYNDEVNSDKDANMRGIHVGMEWDGTAQTSGSAQVGWTFRDMPRMADVDTSTYTWDANVNWRPLRRTQLDLKAMRGFGEGKEVASYYTNSLVGLTMTHRVRSFLDLKAGSDYTWNRYNTGKVNKIWNGSLGIDYSLPRYVVLGAEYSLAKNDSNTPGSGYVSNDFMVTAKGTLGR